MNSTSRTGLLAAIACACVDVDARPANVETARDLMRSDRYAKPCSLTVAQAAREMPRSAARNSRFPAPFVASDEAGQEDSVASPDESSAFTRPVLHV